MTSLKKKFIGTSVLFLFLLSGILVSARSVFAQFIQSTNSLELDGIVTHVTSSSFSLDTTGASAPVVIWVDARTQYPNSTLGSTSITIGKHLSVLARQNGATLLARSIRSTPTNGYGAPASQVTLQSATVTAKNAHTLTVTTGAASLVFSVTPNTLFAHTTYAALVPGTSISIIGTDTGTALIADTISLR